jgi:hypothetical protein
MVLYQYFQAGHGKFGRSHVNYSQIVLHKLAGKNNH